MNQILNVLNGKHSFVSHCNKAIMVNYKNEPVHRIHHIINLALICFGSMHTIYHTSFTFPKYYESNKKKFRQTCFRQNTFDFLNLSLYDDRRSQGSIKGNYVFIDCFEIQFYCHSYCSDANFRMTEHKNKETMVLTKMFDT